MNESQLIRPYTKHLSKVALGSQRNCFACHREFQSYHDIPNQTEEEKNDHLFVIQQNCVQMQLHSMKALKFIICNVEY